MQSDSIDRKTFVLNVEDVSKTYDSAAGKIVALSNINTAVRGISSRDHRYTVNLGILFMKTSAIQKEIQLKEAVTAYLNKNEKYYDMILK